MSLLAVGCGGSGSKADGGGGDEPDGGGATECTPGAGGTAGMAFIAEGSFEMGCDDGGALICNTDMQPVHTVTVCDFEIDINEVTMADYQACIDAQACTAPFQGFNPVTFPNYPVQWVTWQQAVDYCEFAGKRLPTEAEWEFAARGTASRIFPWGNADADCTLAQASSCDDTTAEVGSFPSGQTPEGVNDMIGNVAEWTNDWYAENYFTMSPPVDPRGPTSGDFKVVKGGGFSFPGFKILQASHRHNVEPDDTRDFIGIRCAK
jgi:formylglycine-generating enzyme required for sulfatase activity